MNTTTIISKTGLIENKKIYLFSGKIINSKKNEDDEGEKADVGDIKESAKKSTLFFKFLIFNGKISSICPDVPHQILIHWKFQKITV